MSTKLFVSRPAAIVPPARHTLQSAGEFCPICDGRALVSPDKRFLARATSTYGPRFSRLSTCCYEFVVEDRAGKRLQYVEVPVPRDELINWRLEGSIIWSSDNSSVTFESRGTSLTLLIELKQ